MQKSQAYGQRLAARPGPDLPAVAGTLRGGWSGRTLWARGPALRLGAHPCRPHLFGSRAACRRAAQRAGRRTRYRVVRGGAPSGPVVRTTAAVPRSLRHSAHLVQRLPPVTETISRLLRAPRPERGGLACDQRPLSVARHDAGRPGALHATRARRAGVLAGRGRHLRADHRQRDGHRSPPRLQ